MYSTNFNMYKIVYNSIVKALQNGRAIVKIKSVLSSLIHCVVIIIYANTSSGIAGKYDLSTEKERSPMIKLSLVITVLIKETASSTHFIILLSIFRRMSFLNFFI